MSCRAQFFPCNLVTRDETLITVSNEDPFFPNDNLKHPFLTKVMRTQDGTETLQLNFDFKTAENINACLVSCSQLNGFGFHGSVKVKGNATNEFSSPAVDVLLYPEPEFNLGHVSFDTVEYRFWQVEFESIDYVEVSKLYIGPSIKLESNNMDYGWTYENVDRSRITENRYGQKFIDVINDQTRINGMFKYLNKDELETLLGVFDFVGTSKPFWFMVDETETIISDKERFAGYFHLVKRPVITNGSFSLYDLSFELIGAL